MVHIDEDKNNIELLKNLKIDCKNCFGFCCVALYFSASDGFPTNKKSGKPCINLKSDFSCSIHKDLRKKGLKGCTAYDCFGAGQKVAQVTYSRHDWMQTPKSANQMFEVFLIMRQLHEMLWYLAESLTLIPKSSVKEEISLMFKETEKLTNLDAESIVELDVEEHRAIVNSLLKQANELAKSRVLSYKKLNLKHKKNLASGYDFIGANLTNTNLIGANLAGALLIAADIKGNDLTGANFIGADLRDTDIRGANLEDSIFLTQSQINTAKGNSNTKLPKSLHRPFYWEK